MKNMKEIASKKNKCQQTRLFMPQVTFQVEKRVARMRYELNDVSRRTNLIHFVLQTLSSHIIARGLDVDSVEQWIPSDGIHRVHCSIVPFAIHYFHNLPPKNKNFK